MSAERIRSQAQENTSGQGKGTELPDELKGLNWIRGIGNKTTIALLALIPFVNPVMAQEKLRQHPDVSLSGSVELAANPAMKEKGKPDLTAVRQLKVQAAKGNTDAQVRLGDLYLTGKGVFKNGSLAATWYQTAAEKGNALGQYKIAIMYLEGVYLPLDSKEAGKWLKKAARQGHAGARETLVIRLGETPPPVMKPKK